MSAGRTDNKEKFKKRARFPFYLRIGSLALLAAAVIVIAIGFYRNSGQAEFRMKGLPATLSEEVVAVIEGYERQETENGRLLYSVKADRVTTFSDNHQELENVTLDAWQEGSQVPDAITANKAIYVPGENKDFTVFFAGDVDVKTADGLSVKTDNITYKRAAEIAEAEEHVDFQRDNIIGSSYGAIVKIAEKKAELLRDVKIETTGSPEGQGLPSGLNVTAGYAMYDQIRDLIALSGSVHVISSSVNGKLTQKDDVRADRAELELGLTEAKTRELKKAELFDNVRIVSDKGDGKPVNVSSGYALYDRQADRFDLKNNVHIVAQGEKGPVDIRAVAGVYDQRAGKVWLEGGAEIVQGTELVKGRSIYAELHPARTLKNARVNGDAYLKQTTPERTVEVFGDELRASFDDKQQMTASDAVGKSRAVMTPVNAKDYSSVTMSAPDAMRLIFAGGGKLDKVTTEGRTTILLSAPNGGPDASTKKVTADVVKTFFNSDGRTLRRAEAVGKAELDVDPVAAIPANYRTVINAPRFDCDFFQTGNNVRLCEAGKNTKTVRTPKVSGPTRGVQTITAVTLNAVFSENTRDLDRLVMSGSTKFTELDRNGSADRLEYTASDRVVRLRGGEPTVWDSRARGKAAEIDWDTANRRSFLRGNASTTYYSVKQASGAVPFAGQNAPVFITADTAEIDHAAETAVYKGNARAWQDKNYVRSDALTIRQRQGEMTAEGSVQSMLYGVERKRDGKTASEQVYATAGKMEYNRESNVIVYERDVNIRQGTDRLTGGIARIYLDGRNELSRADLEQNVVITQPGRRASGSFARYIAAEETVQLRGDPARIEDSTRGSSQGSEMTMYMRENRAVVEGGSETNSSGRTRSVYKIKNN